MARLYGNENVSFRIVDALREMGHDVLTSKDAGNANLKIDDPEVLAFAYRERRTVMTNNRNHFIKLHRRGDEHLGIVAYTARPDAEAIAQRIDAALRDDQARGRFLARVDGMGHRFDP